jgi:hypothetical protein
MAKRSITSSRAKSMTMAFGTIAVVVKLAVAAFSLPFLLAACYLLWVFHTDIYQAYKLSQYASEFHRIQHPSGTLLVESYQGYPSWGENECAYFVGELRMYANGEQEIIEFYSEQKRKEPLSEHTYVTFIKEQELTETIRVGDEPRYKDDLAIWTAEDAITSSYDWGISLSTLEGQHYVVYFVYIGRAYLDYKCH